MWAECVTSFKDLDCGRYRDEGDVFEVTESRLRAINSTRYGQLARPVEANEPKRTAPRSRRAASKRASNAKEQ